MKTATILFLLTALAAIGNVLATDIPATDTEQKTDSIDCTEIARAHAALLSGCFSARREFTATINGKLAMRELSMIKYNQGALTVDVLEKEHPNKGIQIGGEGDMVVDAVFACARFTRDSKDRYELVSADEPERVTFDYDADNGVLLPLRWEFEERARFLFKKYHLQAHADYSEVSYDSCGQQSTADKEN